MDASQQPRNGETIIGALAKMWRIGALILLPFFQEGALAAAAPTGKIVWWGQDCFWEQYYTQNTNGVIERNHEIVTNAVSIATIGWQALLLKDDGTVLGVGRDFQDRNDAQAGLSNVVSITGDRSSYWAIKSDSTVAQWGTAEQDDAGIVSQLTNVVSVTSAGKGYLALQKDGTVLGFRLDHDQQTEIRKVTVRGEILTNVATIASYGATPIILNRDGAVLRLGYQTPGAPPVEPRIELHDNVIYEFFGGESGQLPYQYTSLEPVLINRRPLTNVVALSNGGSHFLALRKDGTILGFTNYSPIAASVPADLSNVIAIAAAEHESVALKADGTVVAWGENYCGQTNVPAGLSNVIAIASAGRFNLALTTGSIPSSVFIIPHGRLASREREADLIFKGQVLSSSAITNAGFPDWGNPHATRLRVVSTLKGKVNSEVIEFRHNTHGPNGWSGGDPPPDFILDVDGSYLIFAARADKPDYLYSPPTNTSDSSSVFRQLMRGPTPLRTKDNRQIVTVSVKESHWIELNLLLNDRNPTNQLYAIEKLDGMSLAGRESDWLRSEDFERKDVLQVLLPLATNKNEQIVSRALNCFLTETNAAMLLEPFAATLVKLANEGTPPNVRIDSIRALSGTHLEGVSNSLSQLLQDSDDHIKTKAVALLELYPGEFSELALRQNAEDSSPCVRTGVANVIGNKTLDRLLPILAKLFANSSSKKQPVATLAFNDLDGGGNSSGIECGIPFIDQLSYRSSNNGDVYTSSGYALLKFDAGKVAPILKTNLHDAGFRLLFILKLAESDSKSWINDLVQIMEARRAKYREVAATNSIAATQYLSLSDAYFRCWNVIINYLQEQSASEFAAGKFDRHLAILESGGYSGSREPVLLYELYKQKGLDERASRFRRNMDNYSHSDLAYFFNDVDAKYSTNRIKSAK